MAKNSKITLLNLLKSFKNLSQRAMLEETDSVCHLLLTFSKTYDNIVTVLETMEQSKLTIKFVKSKLMDQEIMLQVNC